MPVPAAYLAVGGGSLPSSTEVSLEQDLVLAQEVLGADGVVLFAGGSGSRSVRELATTPLDSHGELLVELGMVFMPRQGRDSRYRASRLLARAATHKALLSRLRAEFAQSTTQPLLLYIAAHGEQGETASDNAVVLWGGGSFSVRELAQLHDDSARPLRMVITSCFSGGFAESVFRGADPAQGIAVAPRCGLFAGTWDRETSGCDPNPDRREQEGYGIHMLQALRGRDRDGHPVALAKLDVNGDKRVSFLEAHAWAKMSSTSIDVPTTTSERYLREVQKVEAPAGDLDLLPEDAAVLEALGSRLDLKDRRDAEQRLEATSTQSQALEAEVEEAERAADDAYYALASVLLARWPVLDDPYHPDFGDMLSNNEAAISHELRESPQASAFRAASERLQELDERYGELRVKQAMLLRYGRASETLRLARALRLRGGEEYDHYRALLACERGFAGE